MSSTPPSPGLPSPALPSFDEAAALVAAYAAQRSRVRPDQEQVELGQAAGRVLAEPLLADLDQPPFARSTRDGYACRAAEASTHAPLAIAGASRAGDPPSGPLPPGAAWEIMTGAPVPAGADAVAMLEHVEDSPKHRSAGDKAAHASSFPRSLPKGWEPTSPSSEGTSSSHIRLLRPRTLKPGENIVAKGAQACAGDELLPAGAVLRSGQIALAATCGYASLAAYLRPRVAILTTGDELVPIHSSPAPGQIRNSNAPMLASLVANAGGEPWILPTAADNPQALDEAIAQAAAADLLLISGGVSAGRFDLVEPALASFGARFRFTGVRIQPGKPAVFGELPRHISAGSQPLPFFGLPGNPLSSAITFLLFAAPVLAALAGSRESSPRFALAQLAPPADRHSKPGLTRFLPASCTFSASTDQLPQASFVPWHGSGDLVALARSNCFLVVPEDVHRLEPGSLVRILLL